MDKINNLTQEEAFKMSEEVFGIVPNLVKEYQNYPGFVGLISQATGYALGNPKNPLTVVQREWIAFQVSIFNNCFYCKNHHGAAYKKAAESKGDLKEDEKKFLTEFSKVITHDLPKAKEYKEKFVQKGYTVEQFRSAIIVASLFNLWNRLADTMDVALEGIFDKK